MAMGPRGNASDTMAAVDTDSTMDQYLPPEDSMPTFGPRQRLSDEEVRGILETLGLGGRYDARKLTMHDMIEVAAFGENYNELTQEQFALLTNDPGNFLDWFQRHHGDACIHATATTPGLRLRPGTSHWPGHRGGTTDLIDFDEQCMAIVLPSVTAPREWNPLCYAMLKRNEAERMTQERFEDLTLLQMKFDEGIIPWLLERGAVFDGLPSRSSHLHNDFFARALTYMDDDFLEGMLPLTIDSLGSYATPSGCPLVLIALDHGHFTVARSLLEHGADGSVTGSIHGIFTDLDNPAFDQFYHWLAEEVQSFDTFLSTVLPALLASNPLPRLRGVPDVVEHIAKFVGVKSGSVMRRIRDAKSRFGLTMATRQRRSYLLNRVADMYTIDRRYGRDTPTRVWGGLTATPEPVHRAAREKFNELWKHSLELDPPTLTLPQRVQFRGSVSPTFASAAHRAEAASTPPAPTAHTSSASSDAGNWR